MEKQLTKDFKQNIQIMDEILRINESFDLIHRDAIIGGRKACLYCVDGFSKDEILQKLLQYFEGFKPDQIPKDANGMSEKLIAYGEVDVKKDIDAVITDVLSGVTALFIDGYDQAIEIDCRTYPSRGVEEPDKDKTLRGSKDGFVETIVFNTALIRRRIRDPKLTMHYMCVGKTSKTDVVISYLDERVDPKILDSIIQKIQNIDIDALTMNQESLAECLYQRKWYNPFPKFKYTERPDAAAASILEGSIIVLVDNSPSAMVIPATIFDIVEEADDYYFPPITGTYLRLSRMVMNVLALILTPTFLLYTMRPDLIPKWLQFIQIKDPINVPVVAQFLIFEFAIDGLKLASLNTPNMLSTPLSVVAGIVLGDFTVSSGWFNSEVMLYMAFVAISNYTQVSYELGYALKFLRIINLILTAIFGLYGYIAGLIIAVCAVAFNKTLAGTSYLYPLIPFNGRQLFRRFFRVSLPRSEK